MSVRDYAQREGVHEEIVTKWCRNAALPPEKRNKRFPAMKAKRRGRDWRIDLEGTELAQSLQSGTSIEKEAAKRSIRESR